MTLPRFSLRTVLLIVAGSGVVLVVPMLALRGSSWATGATVGLLSLLAVFIVHAVFFLGAWALSLLWNLVVPQPAEHSPFRAETPELAKTFGQHVPASMAMKRSAPPPGVAGAPRTDGAGAPGGNPASAPHGP